MTIFENGDETDEKQSVHTKEASKCIENHLKNTLLALVRHLYGKSMKIVEFAMS